MGMFEIRRFGGNKLENSTGSIPTMDTGNDKPRLTIHDNSHRDHCRSSRGSADHCGAYFACAVNSLVRTGKRAEPCTGSARLAEGLRLDAGGFIQTDGSAQL